MLGMCCVVFYVTNTIDQHACRSPIECDVSRHGVVGCQLITHTIIRNRVFAGGWFCMWTRRRSTRYGRVNNNQNHGISSQSTGWLKLHTNFSHNNGLPLRLLTVDSKIEIHTDTPDGTTDVLAVLQHAHNDTANTLLGVHWQYGVDRIECGAGVCPWAALHVHGPQCVCVADHLRYMCTSSTIHEHVSIRRHRSGRVCNVGFVDIWFTNTMLYFTDSLHQRCKYYCACWLCLAHRWRVNICFVCAMSSCACQSSPTHYWDCVCWCRYEYHSSLLSSVGIPLLHDAFDVCTSTTSIFQREHCHVDKHDRILWLLAWYGEDVELLWGLLILY